MQLVFIRHWETIDNIEHCIWNLERDMLVQITKKGEQQALQAGELLKEDAFDAIFVSDMLRTQQTAKAIFGDDAWFIFDTRLREGVVSNTHGTKYAYWEMPLEERVKLRLEWFEDGEMYSNQVNRIKKFLDEIASKEYKKVAVITHGWCLRTLYVIAWLMTLEESLYMWRKDNCGVIRANLCQNWKLEILQS